jgi:hypothetical protein
MIKLGGLMGDSFKLGKMDVKYGQVVSNPFATAFAPQIKEGEEGSDYEVSMAAKQLDDIIKSATELKAKMGEQEFNVAAWIQDHISKSQDYINQANYGFDKNESVTEANGRGFATIQNDLAKVVGTIQSELEKYKMNKGTDKAKQNVENLKKLNVQKQRLEDELDGKVTSLYADYDLDQLHFMGRKK